MLTVKNLLIDLNSIACYFGVPTIGAFNEHGQNNFFSSHGIFTNIRIPQMCRTISRRLQSTELFMHGSIFMYGFCTINLSRKFARYRIVSEIHATEALSHGHSRSSLSQYISQRQQSTRLAYLCRLLAGSNSSSPRTVSRRFIRNRSREYGLRAGLNNHRFVLIAFSMGAFSKEQGGDQTSYAFGFARTDPVIYRYHQRKIRRRPYSGHLNPRGGSFYIMDRSYLDFARLYAMHQAHATFITRAKSNTQYRRLYSRPVDKTTGLRCDQTILLTGVQSAKDYPQQLRLIKFFDSEINKRFTFLTNNFEIDALTVAQLYKCRWKVELFFRWIKQHLRIKAFLGTSQNAVKSQLWITISVYVLVAIIKKHLSLKPSLYIILQILSVTIFEKTPILQALTETKIDDQNAHNDKQLTMFNL